MVRRFQLMEPERGLRPRLARATARLRDGLLRDNKVIPPVLGALALIVFAWIVAGALIDDPGEGGGRREVANQANQPSQQVAQNPEQGQQGADNAETPAPSVENRDAESYAAFEQKDPFRDLFGDPGSGAGGDQYGDNGDGGGGDGTGDGDAGDDQYDDGGGDGGGDGGSDGGSDGGGGGGDDFIDQTFPGDPGFGDGGGGGGSGGGGSGGGDDDLFDSGGNLTP